MKNLILILALLGMIGQASASEVKEVKSPELVECIKEAMNDDSGYEVDEYEAESYCIETKQY